jgi:hypothetical protein
MDLRPYIIDFDLLHKNDVSGKGIIYLQNADTDGFELITSSTLLRVMEEPMNSGYSLNFVAHCYDDMELSEDFSKIISDELPYTIINVSAIWFDINSLRDALVEAANFLELK